MKRLRTFFVTMIFAIAAFTLSACGGSAEPDENSGVYEAVSAKAFGLEMAIDELYEGGMSIELKDGGKAVFTLEGKDYKMKWSHDGKDFQAKGGGAELEGTVEDGALLLTNLMGSGVDIRLECKSLMRKSSGKGGDSGGDQTDAVEDAGQPIHGRYEAIAVNPSGEEDEIPIPEGDYMTIGEDDTIQMFFETDDGMQQNDFSTEIRDGKVYLNGNVNVGEFRSDGSVFLNINDEINYIYAKEGSAPWKEWQAYLAEKSGDTDAGDAGLFGYDFETALEYVGDWHGFCVMPEGAYYLGEDFSNVKITAFARMVIDEEGEPLVWFRHTNDDQMNFEGSVAIFDEDGWMVAGGILGETEWYADVDPPDPDTGVIRFRGETQDGKELFTMYLKQFGQLWETGDLPVDQFDNDLLPLYNQIVILPDGWTMKEFLADFTRDFQPLHQGTTRAVLNNEIPDNDLLYLYQ
ncbi:MAG: hypothetical protein IJQ12_04755 [Lachnospiraceae bacterium]|nr:hypothetical protein [Lachnospiraceae bacterium]